MRYLSLLLFFLTLMGCEGSGPSSSATPSDAEKLLLRWDFSQPKTLVYDFQQISFTRLTTGSSEAPTELRKTVNGTLKLKIRDNGRADVLLQQDPAEGQLETPQPVVVLQDVEPDGAMRNAALEGFFSDLLFVLPPDSISKDDNYFIPKQMPFNAGGSRLMVQGFTDISFGGFSEIGGHRCTVIKATTDISNLTVPPELNGDYRSSLKADATYHFDLKNGRFHSVNIELKSAYLVAPPYREGPGSPYSSEMEDESSITLKFTGEEEP